MLNKNIQVLVLAITFAIQIPCNVFSQNIILNGDFENEEDGLAYWETRTIEGTNASATVIDGEVFINNVSGVRFTGEVSLHQSFSEDQISMFEEDELYTISFDGRSIKFDAEILLLLIEVNNASNNFLANTTITLDSLMTSYSQTFEFDPIDVSNEIGIYIGLGSGDPGYYFDNIKIEKEVITSAETSARIPSFELIQNYPNPFNPSTNISFTISQPSILSLKIYDLMGREVAHLIDDSFFNPGKYSVKFDASSLPSGIYMYQLSSDKLVQSKKMTLIK